MRVVGLGHCQINVNSSEQSYKETMTAWEEEKRTYLTSENKSKVAANAIIPSGTGLLSRRVSVES